MTFMAFSSYAPDSANKNADASACIINVFPDSEGYIPCPKPIALTTALEGINTIYCHKFLDGEVALFAATSNAIYRWYQYIADNDSNGWVDVTRKKDGNVEGYNCFDEQGWSFCSFNDLPFAANIGDTPQIWDRKLQRFRDLKNIYNEDGQDKDDTGKPYEASPVPYTRKIVAAGDYLFMVGTSQNPSRLVWSGTKQPEMWQAGVAGSSFNDFMDGGEVVDMQSAVSPFVLLRRAIYQLTRTPTEGSFSVQKIFSNRGCAVKNSVANADGICFFMDEDGFHSIGSEGLDSIGFQIVDRTFSKLISTRRSDTKVTAVSDAKNSRVFWTVYNMGKETAYTIVYDYRLKKWSKLSFGGESATMIPLQATDLDDLNKFDPVQFSFDSDAWQAEESRLAFLDGGIIKALIGINARAIIESGDIGDTANKMTLINNIYPNVDAKGFNMLADVGFMMKDGAPMERIWREGYSQSKIDGGFRPLIRGKALIVRLMIPEGTDWTKAQGVDVQFAALKTGNR